MTIKVHEHVLCLRYLAFTHRSNYMHNLRVQEGDNQCRFLLKKVKIDIKISVPYALKSCHSPRLYMYIYAIIKYHIVNVTMSRKGVGGFKPFMYG